MKIAIITGSRADWNGLGMVGMALRDEHKAKVEVVCIGAQANRPCQAISDDGFTPLIVTTDTGFDIDIEIGVSTGRATDATARLLGYMRPDMALVLGDRFEILGAATAVALLRIPLAHIGGGDITEGSIDNRLRYAITALSDLHFATNLQSLNQLINRYGIDGRKAWSVGNPALDRIRVTKPLAKSILFKALGLKPRRRNILVAFHAATTEADPVGSCLALTHALHRFADGDTSFLIIGTNTDTGSVAITNMLRNFAETLGDHAVMRDNLLPIYFYSCLQYFDCMVGNSSAGIIETAPFGIPTVNIWPRQDGRPLPGNVRSCAPTTAAIEKTIGYALCDQVPAAATESRAYDNPYGDGHSAPRIAKLMIDQMAGA